MNFKILDLFCGGGGAAIGISQSNHPFDIEITGIDINPQPDYPFKFIQANIKNKLPVDINNFDFIWASPPCQAWSAATQEHHHEHENLIPRTREILESTSCPTIIENVPQAPIDTDLLLCGSMFGLKTYRHRIFEIEEFRVEQPRHPYHLRKTSKGEMFCCVGDQPMNPGQWGKKDSRRRTAAIIKEKTMAAGGPLKLYQNTLGCNHITKIKTLSECVPPAYSKYIFNNFLFKEGYIEL